MEASRSSDPDRPVSGRLDLDQLEVGRVLAGNVDAFNVLVSRYQRQVYRLGCRFLFCREDAQDYAQEVFLKAYQHLRQYRYAGRFYSWLMSIAVNYGKDCVKRPRPPLEVRGIDLSQPGTGPEGRVLRELARRELYSAVETLPPPVVTCIDLHCFLGFTCDDVAWVTEIPSNTVKSHIRRAKQYLKVRLSGTVAEIFHGDAP